MVQQKNTIWEIVMQLSYHLAWKNYTVFRALPPNLEESESGAPVAIDIGVHCRIECRQTLRRKGVTIV